jgi:hypothetical protein
MFEYRPPWAVAMTLNAMRKVHLRSGWAAGLGFYTWCKRSSVSDGAALKTATEGHWVSLDDIQNREIHDPEDLTRTTCERCCLVWIRDYERNSA